LCEALCLCVSRRRANYHLLLLSVHSTLLQEDRYVPQMDRRVLWYTLLSSTAPAHDRAAPAGFEGWSSNRRKLAAYCAPRRGLVVCQDALRRCRKCCSREKEVSTVASIFQPTSNQDVCQCRSQSQQIISQQLEAPMVRSTRRVVVG
jgi:hypothetical protein